MRIASLFLLVFLLGGLRAQRNVELVGHLPYDTELNDIWGWVAPDGTEYALVGTREGVSIVSLAEPGAPQEVQFVAGSHSIWRDLKTWEHFAFVTTDQPGTDEGLTVIDLSGLPASVSVEHWRPLIAGDTLRTCHNLFIDEFGFAYLAGCNVNLGGAVIVDVGSQPGQPQLAGLGNPVYAHDVYARANRLYTSEILLGQFGVYDVSDKSAVQLLATQQTPFAFTHNAWLSDDGSVLFTTDEKPNAFTAAYDISNLDDIRLLDAYRPLRTEGSGVIPHNVHVLNDFLVISHYTDGLLLVDAARPANLIEVGHYDTQEQFSSGFHGAWGAYPFLPSGLVLVSDIEGGLFVLRPTYQRACYLEGKVTNAETGAPEPDVLVEILSADLNRATSKSDGAYRTGQLSPGTFEVRFRKTGFFDKIATATLQTGQVTPLDVALEPLPEFTIRGRVMNALTYEGLFGITVRAENSELSFTTQTDGDGFFELPVVQGTYDVFVGAWGWSNGALEFLKIESDRNLDFALQPGYFDDFNLDLGWTVSGDAKDGAWERGIPNGTVALIGNDVVIANPSEDSPDPGRYCFVTGNSGTLSNDDDVDEGRTWLVSPPMDLRSFNLPVLQYQTWFFNKDSNIPADDSLAVFLTNGPDTVLLESIRQSRSRWEPSGPLLLEGLLPLTDSMRVLFFTGDLKSSGHILEAAVDAFALRDSLPDHRFTFQDEDIRMTLRPNPFHDRFLLDYAVEGSPASLRVHVFNAMGQRIESRTLPRPAGTLEWPNQWSPGLYLFALEVDGRLRSALKGIRH